MKPKIRIISFHYIPNNGAFLFAYSLSNLLKKWDDFDVKLLDYKEPKLAIYEYLKRYNFFQNSPLFYIKRARMWKKEVASHLSIDGDFPRFANGKILQEYFSREYKALVVGMDVWCVNKNMDRPSFPNLYWLPEKTGIQKMAYSISAYHSDNALVQSHSKEITRYLNDFDVIGTRDKYTHEIVQKHRSRRDGLVEKVPDPTFAFDIKKTNVKRKLAQLGVDFSQPILGLLLYGDKVLSGNVFSHYRAKRYQILSLSMYNPIADFNLGHILTPLEWAEVFRYFSFCITDRFHGAVFCLLNKTPFISVEKERYLPKSQSKIYDLLEEFDLGICYQNPSDQDFDIASFLQHADELEACWNDSINMKTQSKIDIQRARHINFVRKAKLIIKL